MKSISICIFVILFASKAFALSGSLSGFVVCPYPGTSGYTMEETFALGGPTPPDDATVTLVTGSWQVFGYNPDLVVLFGSDSIGWVDASNFEQWQTLAYTGIPIPTTFSVRMFVNGPYEPTGITGGGTCNVNVNWTAPDPVGPSSPKSIKSLQIITGQNPGTSDLQDVNGDGKIGLEEAIDYLRQ